MLTIKAEIKRGEQCVDGTYNVKIRFTLGRQVKRLSTSLFAKPEDLTKSFAFKDLSVNNVYECKVNKKLGCKVRTPLAPEHLPERKKDFRLDFSSRF